MFSHIFEFIDLILNVLFSRIDGHPGMVTLFVGVFVFVVYRAQKVYEKSNAAKLILQEIRYAEQKVRNFDSHGSYNLSEKVLPTNNWNDNISLFVKELGETEIDQISDFFSSAARLDEVLKAVADFRNQQTISSPGGPGTISGVQTTTGELPKEAKELILKVSQGIISLYNTPATDRLRQIADHKKWYKKL